MNCAWTLDPETIRAAGKSTPRARACYFWLHTTNTVLLLFFNEGISQKLALVVIHRPGFRRHFYYALLILSDATKIHVRRAGMTSTPLHHRGDRASHVPYGLLF